VKVIIPDIHNVHIPRIANFARPSDLIRDQGGFSGKSRHARPNIRDDVAATVRPSFNALQNGAAGAAIFYYVFDVLVLAGRNLMGETLARRRPLPGRDQASFENVPSRQGARLRPANQFFPKTADEALSGT
jgi:hypothetical protein